MVKVTVFNYNSLFKYIRFAIIIILSLACLFFLYNFHKFNLKNVTSSNYYEFVKYCLNENINSMKFYNNSTIASR